MSKSHSRTQDFAASLGVSIGVLAGEIPAPSNTSHDDPWIKVTPRGATKTRDGRSYSFTPETLVDRLKTDAVDLPADFDHGIALNAIKGVKTPAIGWASDLQARPDGTYAKMDWLPDGKAALAARSHRYISPTFHHDPSGNATWLHSISLTTAPSLTMPAVASALATGGDTVDTMASLAAAVGLPADADLGAVLKAARQALAGSVPKAAHEATLAALTTATGQLGTLTAETRKAEVEAAIGEALREKKIVPAQRDLYVAMCATPAGLDTFRGLMATTLPMLQPSGIDGRKPLGADRPATAQAFIDRAAGYRADKAKLGIEISLTDAIAAIANQPVG